MSSPRPAPPPLTRFGEIWRITLAALVGLLLWFGQFTEDPPPATVLPLLDLVLGTAAIIVLHWRRRWPAAVALLTTLVTAVSALGSFASVIALVSLVTTRRWRAIVPVALLAIGTGYVYDAMHPLASDSLPWWSGLLVAVLVTVITVVFGLYVGARRELAVAARERLRTAEREQEARVEQARLGERTRIAREMHDVLAHRISLVALHAGAMTYRTDLGADELRTSARVVQENAHQALAELRDVLGVLRDPTPLADGAPVRTLPPQPTLADLSDLVAESRQSGTPVELRLELADLAAVPGTVARTAYRILQEALTNARKHAPGAPVVLRVSGQPGSRLELEATNPLLPAPVGVGSGEPGPSSAGTLPGAGLGLVGLAERATLAGGALAHGRTSTGRYRVHAWLPWAA